MTQEVLVQIIFLLCNGMTVSPSQMSDYSKNVVKEYRIECFENYVNCGVGTGGKIMTMTEFKDKCIKKSSK